MTAPSQKELLAMASKFDILSYDSSREGIRWISVVKRSIKPESWSIFGEYGVLAHDGRWQLEPQPSDRTDEYYKMCRWPTALEAIEFARDHIKKFPLGHNPADTT